jgi:polyphosphate kinase
LRPGVAGLSESVQVVSVVGRFLEHSRIAFFRNAGNHEYYIGSADFMKRNLESRVEAMVPVEDPKLQTELRFLIDAQLSHRQGVWEMGQDGRYFPRQPAGDDDVRGPQELLIEWAEIRHKEATRLRKRKPKGIARRQVR